MTPNTLRRTHASPFERLEPRRLLSVSAVAPDQVVVMQTSLGPIAVELLDESPLSKANFLSYVTSGAYNNTLVHRTTFTSQDGIGVIQAGGYKATDFTHITTNPPIANEFNAARPNKRGTISMARTADQNSATSEFFINTVDNPALDNAAQGNAYAVFGNVIRGMGVADAINGLQHATNQSDPFSQLPVTRAGAPVTISSAVARDELTVVIGGAEPDKSVSFTDLDGTVTTVSIAGPGAVTLKFTGSALTATRVGTRVVVGGNNVELQRTDVAGATAASSLTIKPAGGAAKGAAVGTINVAGGLASLNAAGVRIAGDLTSTGGVRKITLDSVGGGTVSIGSAAGFPNLLDLTANSLANSTVVSDVAINKLSAKDWSVNDGTTRAFTAPQIKTLSVPGGFGADMNVGGTVGSMLLGVVSNTNVIATVFAKATVGSLQNSLLGGLSQKGQAPGIVSLSVRGAVANSTVISIGDMGTVKLAAGMNNSDVIAGANSLPAAGQFPATFSSAGTLFSLQVGGTFADSRVAATNIAQLRITRAQTSLSGGATSGTVTGLKADKIGLMQIATDQNQKIAATNLDTQSQFDALAAKNKLKLNAFSVVLV